MTEFYKEDIEPLDFIVKRTLETGFAVNADDLVKADFISLKDERGYAIVAADFEVSKQFDRFLHILNKNGICKCYFDEDAKRAESNSYTLQFQKQGGFETLYKNLKKIEKQEKLEFRKIKIDTELAEKTLKEFPRTKWFARIGFLIAVILALKELYLLFI